MKGLCVVFCLSYIIIPWMLISGQDEDRELASVLSTDFDEAEQFPDTIELKFDHNGNEVHLNLAKDEEATRILSPQVVENSYFLPDDLFDYDTQHEFTAYRAGESDIVLVHRPSQYHAPKFYGRYTDGTDRHVIHSHEDDHAMLYIKSDVQRVRKRRQIPDAAYVEVFLIADNSLYEYFNTAVIPGSTNNEIKQYLADYMYFIIKDVDTIFSDVSTTYPIRAHFMQYQVVVSTDKQPWMAATSPVTATAVTALQNYYLNTLVALYAFPTPDILIQLTRYTLDGNVNSLSSGEICQSTTSFPTVILNGINYVQQKIAQAIASRMNVGLDDGTGGCEDSDRNIMSSTFGPVSDVSLRGNRWTFSSCSKSDITTKLSSNSYPCLYTEDSLFAFDDSPQVLGDVFTNAEQCIIVYGSSFNESCSTVDCYTDDCSDGTTCKDTTFGQNSTCGINSNVNVDFKCNSGFCTVFGETTTSTTSSTSSTSSTTSSTTSTTAASTTSTTASSTSTAASTTSTTEATTSTAATATTTEDDQKQTTTTEASSSTTTAESDCIVETGSVEFDLPGCGCCGGCGCDDECTDCDPGLPSFTKTEDCIPAPDCCGSKVRVTTLFVPDGCSHNYVEGPRTIIQEKKGWQNPETDITAEVYQDNNDRWQVQLVPQN